MENLLIYQDDGAGENSWIIGEKKEKYIDILDAKIGEYIEQLRDFESRCSNSDTRRETLLNEITLLNDSIFRVFADFERAVGFNKDIIKKAQAHFRLKTNLILSKSHFINHARTWPRGYPGDYKILESAYRNAPMSGGIGFYLDRYCLSTTLSVAVRERKTALCDLLRTELMQRKEPRILNIACGSCREIVELAPDIKSSAAKVTCIDFDSDALNYAVNRISYTGISLKQIELRKYNALKMVNHERNLKEFGMQDVIYSVGFFDYLEDNVLLRLFDALYQLLSPGGRLVTSFKDSRRYSTQFYHWMVDWDAFCQRTEEDCQSLFKKMGISFETVNIKRDESGVIMFFVITK